MAAQNTGDDLTAGQTNHEQDGFELVADPTKDGGFGNDFILRVVQSDGLFSTSIDGLQAQVSDGRGVSAFSSRNDGVVGESTAGLKSGVVGINDNNVGVFGRGANQGVLGNSGGGNGVEGDSSLGVGVLGRSNSASGVVGLSGSGSGVSGMSDSGVGVIGGSNKNDGVLGTSNAPNRSGVVGLNANNVGVFGRGVTGIFGVGQAGQGFTTGVLGAAHDWGVRGISDGGFGVVGEGGTGQGIPVGVAGDVGNGYGVQATSDTYIGILAACGDDSGNPGVAAGVFAGDVVVNGNLTVTGGVKSAAIRHRDGSHRRLYSLESPESWLEDFGEAQLVKGRADVKLEPSFLAVVNMDKYHVFLTPYGDSNGLYVSRRGKKGFEVRERRPGKASLLFSYRIVAKRADIDSKRFAKVILPEARVIRPPRGTRPNVAEAPRRPSHNDVMRQFERVVREAKVPAPSKAQESGKKPSASRR